MKDEDYQRDIIDSMNRPRVGIFSITLLCLMCMLPLMSCARLALRFSPSLIDNISTSLFEECDPELAREAIPSSLKLMEGLLKEDPHNPKILITLSMGFTGYGLLFVEDENRERASSLYLRARDYALKALGEKGRILEAGANSAQQVRSLMKEMGEADLEALFWATMSWNAWTNLNLDHPAALAQLGLLQGCVERALELNPAYFYGLPHLLMGSSLAARPPLFGGNFRDSKVHFEKAIELSHRKFFLIQYFYARYYAVRVQDKGLFLELLKEIIEGDPGSLKKVCLMNAVIQQKARELKEKAEDLFY